MRLLGVLALAAPVAVGILFLTVPNAMDSWFDEGTRSILAALVAGALGVSLTAGVVATYFRHRFDRLIKAAEQIAGGDYTTHVARPGTGLEGRLGTAVNEIARALADTYDRATIDRLTGVANRRAVLAELFTEVERASRYDRPPSVAFVDIDHFKSVNDTHGHAAGDAVLRAVARTMAENLRASDMIGRYGGEEFMLILTETTVDEGAILTEKLRTSVQRQRYPIGGGQSISVTISIGVAGGSGQHLRMETLVRDADAAMYSAKALVATRPISSPSPTTMPESRVPRSRPPGGLEPSRSARSRARPRRLPSRRSSPRCPTIEASLRRSSPRSSWPSPGSLTCPLPRSTACAWPPCCTILARSRSRRTSWTSRAR